MGGHLFGNLFGFCRYHLNLNELVGQLHITVEALISLGVGKDLHNEKKLVKYNLIKINLKIYPKVEKI